MKTIRMPANAPSYLHKIGEMEVSLYLGQFLPLLPPSVGVSELTTVNPSSFICFMYLSFSGELLDAVRSHL